MSFIKAIEVLFALGAIGLFSQAIAIKRGHYSDFWYHACQGNPIGGLVLFGILCILILAAIVAGDALL